MTRRIVGFSICVVVAVGVAVAVYFASQISDGTTAAQEQAEKPTLTPAAVVVEEPLATVTPTAFVEATVVEPPLDPSPTTLEDELARVEEQLARLEEDCREKGILPPPITPEIIPATPPWLVTPTVRDPVKQLRDALNRASPSQKLIITEDIVVLKLFSVFPEDLDRDRFDPAKFSQDNVGYSIDHIPSLSSISLDRQGRETTRHVGTGGTLSGTQGIAELERVLADPAVLAMILDFLNQPLDPCEVFPGLRNSQPEVCLTPED
jgi:hypothetical protein